MGKLRGGVNGSLSGTAGNLVFYSMNGENYFRTVPGRRGKNSWSERQVLNRKRFQSLASFWKKFSRTPLKLIWQVAEKGKRAHNLFISVNSTAFGPDGTLLDPQRLHFSAGQLPLPHLLTVKAVPNSSDKIDVSWQYDPGNGNARSDDELKMMVDCDGTFSGPHPTGTFRSEESALITLPPEIISAKGIYLFFASDKRNLFSPDQYFALH